MFALPVQLAYFFPSTTMATPTMSTSCGCHHAVIIPVWPSPNADFFLPSQRSPLFGLTRPDSTQDAAPMTDATPPAEVAASVRFFEHTIPTEKSNKLLPVKKVDKDKEKPKKGRGKDKAAAEKGEVQETEYKDNGNGSDNNDGRATKWPTVAKKVDMVTAAPKAGLSGLPNIAIASEAQNAEWMAGYNLVIGTCQVAVEENKVDVFAI
ncbi:hypothetical protein DFH08DRAFT_823870 [Mycena albidolilacea]|uniref:Uncharacterized protein n=1 Tax=Mycena albidolilacea TaxID=1033008 RepID=A0AAD6Z5R5_9AGAR|nr:hypothetical protein DFH08DRAFT_823870 [Mycena albidolilacea]